MSNNKITDNFEEWVKEKNKTRIEKAKTRHPILTTVRESAENKIFAIVKDIKEKGIKTPPSVFDHLVKEPSIIDEWHFKFLHKYEDIKPGVISAKNKFWQFYSWIKSSYFKTNQYIDDLYQKSLTEKQKKEIASIENGTQLQNSSYFNKIKFKYYMKINEDENLKKIYEKERINSLIQRKLIYNRMENFWKNVLYIKPNYTIILEKVKKNTSVDSNYTSVFYKFLKISQMDKFTKYFTIKGFFMKFLPVSMFLSFVRFKYLAYLNKDVFIEQNKKIEEYLNKESKDISSYFISKEVDDMFRDTFKLEKKAISELIMHDLNKPADKLGNSFTEEYLQNFQKEFEQINFLQYTGIILQFLIPALQFVYLKLYKSKTKQPLTWKKSFFYSFVTFFLLKEINSNLNSFFVNQLINFPAHYKLKEPNLIFKYQIYKENVPYLL
jgi:hypothetical protein